MRLRSWTVYLGPAIVAAALVPTLVGALIIAAPRDGDQLPGIGAGTGVPPLQPAAPALDPAIEPSAPDMDPAVAPVAPAAPAGRAPSAQTESAPLPCTPLRGRSLKSTQAPGVTVDSVLSRGGEHVGRRVALRARSGAQISVTLPPDSFVGVASGDWLVYGAAGRRGSQVRAIDLETGCDVRLAGIADIARAATLDPAGTTLYVHSVDADTRRDLGVAAIDLATGESSPAVPPFAADDDFGPVFATSLSWSLDGSALVIQSCGADECHSRLLDVHSGEIQLFDEGYGGIVGVTAAELIVFAAGHERPAPLLAIARSGGAARVLVEEAYEAELRGSAHQPLLRVDTPAGWQELMP